MLIAGQIPQALAAGKNENAYISAYNNDTIDIPQGGHCVFDELATAAQFLGRAVKRPTTAALKLYAGVAAFNIVTKIWGIVCVYGVFENTFLDGGTTDGIVGDTYTIANASFYANNPLAGSQGAGWIIAMVAVTATSTTGRALIRAM